MLGGSAGPSGTGEFVAAGFGVGGGGLFMWASDLGVGCGLPPATHLPEPSSSPRTPGTVLGGSAGPFGTGEPVAAGSGVAGGGC